MNKSRGIQKGKNRSQTSQAVKKTDLRNSKKSPIRSLPPNDLRKPNTASAPRTVWWWVRLVTCFFLVCGVTYWAADYFLFTKIPSELVGLWVIDGGEQDGATIEFQRNGRFLANLNVKGRFGKIDARAEVHGKQVHIIDVNPHTGKEVRAVHTIKKLTNDELVMEFEGGSTNKLFRAR